MKKKFCFDREKKFSGLIKLLKVMKLTVFILLVSVASVFANKSYSQSKMLNLNMREATVKEVLNSIEKQSEFCFLYSQNLIDVERKVNVTIENKKIEQVLNLVFKGTDVDYSIRDRFIVLTTPEVPAGEIGVLQQQNSISGKVTDEAGDPLPGVTVLIKGTTNGTVTNVDGEYSLKGITAETTLHFSFIGMKSQEVVVGSQNSIDIVMATDAVGIEEVIAIGYGTQIKEAITGSIQQVDFSELSEVQGAQFTQKLQGKLAGVQISQTTGKPGQGMVMRIRGQASVSAGFSPLYVVDGLPITGDLNSINPNEIESISVLKDASSTSLYGSRAANGVVLITTKKGKVGETSVNVSSYLGVQSVPEKGRPDMMNAREFAQFKKEYAFENGQSVDPVYQNPEQYGEGTDWYDVLLRDARIQDHNITLTSRNERMGVTAVAGFFEQEGVMLNTKFNRYSLRINTDFTINEYAKIGLNVAPNYVSDNDVNTDGSLWGRGILQNALLTTPLAPHINEDGTIPLTATGPGLFPNPNWYNVLKQLDAKRNRLSVLTNAYVELYPVKGLTWKSTINADLGRETKNSFSNSQMGGLSAPPPNTPFASQSHDNNTSWLTEHTATYKKSFERHNLEALLGFSAQEWQGRGLRSKANNYPDDLIEDFSAAPADKRETDNYFNEWSLISYIGRVNYNYANKYFLSAAIRHDGSSRFGEDNRWGNFPSASLGWIVTKEKFMPESDVLNFLKLRASYGVTGNNNIGNYSHRGLVGTYNAVFNENVESGRTVSSIGNINLGWEKTKQLDLGVDMGFLNNRISFSYDYYKKNTTDMLFNVPIPQASGYNNILTNLGEFEFWGHEFVLSSRVLEGTFKLDVDLNYSYGDNKVIALDTPDGELKSRTHISRIGERIGQFYLLEQEGVYVNQADFDASPKYDGAMVGTIKFKDVDGDGKIDRNKDRTVVGNSVPTSLFGITVNAQYKRFDLNIIGSGAAGYYVLNAFREATGNLDGVFNVNKDVMNRWKSENDPGDGLYGRTLSGTTNKEREWWHTGFMSKANNLIIRNITLGYSLPLGGRFINSARVYGSVQNPFVFTSYDGANPEVSEKGSPLEQGIDNTAYPVPRTFSMGINLNF
ncbi:TonB-linked outer membrane protein, SusC/RagA family [Mariniphaga anaerophila]|uniref:TonB-linked outer membrane protein, SusC/RagA family n=1 Tax=Mariniphaga anaerophila TaxID=1484053 RepID=A0A1M4UBL3_9BACT|nr:TonB-dependent receptor [Mariniphaga anaerophila]SHE54036.1 TonB-linked outer membrane protein, SusC/RagA family [Mariniphaga anaerophila]